MSDQIVSLIRTWVPVAIGSVLTWLVGLGVVIPEDAEAGLAVGLTGVTIAVYYAVVRFLEKRWPWFGYLLGRKTPPTYDES